LAHWFHFTPLLDEELILALNPLMDMALILILLSIGMSFQSSIFKRWRHRIFIFSGTEVFLTFILVAGSIFCFNFFILNKIVPGMDSLVKSSLYLALILGTVAIETAPASTLMVIREYESEGPLTDAVTALVGLNNLSVIILFNIVMYYLLLPSENLHYLLSRIFIPLFLGGFIGFMVSVWGQKLQTLTELQLLIFGGCIAILGICRYWNYDILLTALACGMMIANSSFKTDKIFGAIKNFDYVLYVFFFVIAGASLHLDSIVHIGWFGIIYLAGRGIGKIAGTRIGAIGGNFNVAEQRWSGLVMLSQAGIAIGICKTLLNLNAPEAREITTIIYGAVVIFEILGPILIRFGLVKAGEVPLLTMLAKKTPVGTFEGLHQVVDFFRTSIGLPRGHRVGSAKDILVKYIMRMNVNTVHEKTSFNEILRLIAHSRYDRFPVVGDADRFIGVIDYDDIHDVLFEPMLTNLVIAQDLVKKTPQVTYPDTTLGEVLQYFIKHKNVSYLPVVDPGNSEKLVGIVNQNDVLATFRKFKK
ncbi:CBS domain-containing protein, partial [candidate division KSB1 bacterium]|nr:CBS domain-containing protein [candidate division KSB1 bacterium]